MASNGQGPDLDAAPPPGVPPGSDPELLVDEATNEHAKPQKAAPGGPPTQQPAQPVAPPLPLPPPGAAPFQPTPEDAQRAKDRIDGLVKEARATSGQEAAALWFET